MFKNISHVQSESLEPQGEREANRPRGGGASVAKRIEGSRGGGVYSTPGCTIRIY